jgi:dienelactone hydrolase
LWASSAGLVLGQATATVKQAPPPGIAVSPEESAKLESELQSLGRRTEQLRSALAGKPERRFLADVEVFHKAVRYALRYGEFFKTQELASAQAQLALGNQRAQELENGRPRWSAATGPLVRGYFSRIDGSVQPYGLFVPADWTPEDRALRPLYLWFHGRNDTLSEVAFIAGRLKAKPEFAPARAFELHLYGRYCNASKFAGETDAFEAMADVVAQYPIDPERIAIMGFSMGGASVWHLAAHYASRWAAASPGAGFAETAIYAKVYDNKQALPRPWEKTLFHLYDATDYAANLANTSLIAYSGEKDPQKQSAEIMAQAMAKEGLTLEQLVGPNTGHQYEPDTKKELSKRMDVAMARGRSAVPAHVRLVTYTLRYHQMAWVTLDALETHWARAEIEAQMLPDRKAIQVTTKNIAAFTLTPFTRGDYPEVIVDQQSLTGPRYWNGWTAHFQKARGRWRVANGVPRGLMKRHGLSGPIDDAFMDSFLFVRPTGQARHAEVGAWTTREFERAIVEWRRVFRGDVRVKDDRAVTAEDIATCHLVLWGDPAANSMLAKVLKQLPLRWTDKTLQLGSHTLSAAQHVPILIYPNPLNPSRYLVLNSGFTFRQGSTTSNSLQTPKLPDWALIDLSLPSDQRWPGGVVDAGFFDDHWRLSQKSMP